ncbi:unnamed protein product (macronuclear) [Paramecium tetraurelia]|uniref:Uncharacterized protein n=1 Tax=Paramecium tetraurelia TaxID=5888 RepID=A0CRT7_PARTE|nr:uncharacterized protein GSPATT00009819001 [Paramecium tetraurelia]CAK73504.1 unnamed protein product [Paramecium tetraurelia]|eukprot:XP_001440901.1 hypothetical protein (macronuclear) [Paramecium tetraurelia strain d4-2]
MIDFCPNQFLNLGLQTEFTIQSENEYRLAQQNRNKLVSVGSQQKNLNNIEKHRYLKPNSSFEEYSGEYSVICDQLSNQNRAQSITEKVQNLYINSNLVGQEWESQKSIIIVNVDEHAIDQIDLNEFFIDQYSIFMNCGLRISLLSNSRRLSQAATKASLLQSQE